jgi:cell pole-organizing protein PopZ
LLVAGVSPAHQIAYNPDVVILDSFSRSSAAERWRRGTRQGAADTGKADMNKPAKAQEPSMDEILASIRRIIADDDAAKAQTGHSPPPPPATIAPPQPRPSFSPSPGLRPAFSARPIASNTSISESPARQDENGAGDSRVEPAPAREFMVRTAGVASDSGESPAPASPIAAKIPNTPPAPSYAPATSHQPASPYQAAPSYHPAASTPASYDAEPPPVFRDSGGQAMEPAVLRTHDEPRRQLVQSAVEQALLSSNASAAVDSAFGLLTQKSSGHVPAGPALAPSTRTVEDLVQDMLRPMLKNWLDDNLPSLVERLVRAEIERVARGR